MSNKKVIAIISDHPILIDLAKQMNDLQVEMLARVKVHTNALEELRKENDRRIVPVHAEIKDYLFSSAILNQEILDNYEGIRIEPSDDAIYLYKEDGAKEFKTFMKKIME